MGERARFCPNCGRPIEPGAMFCAHCGHKTETEEAPAVHETPDANEEFARMSRKDQKIWLLYLALYVLLWRW